MTFKKRINRSFRAEARRSAAVAAITKIVNNFKFIFYFLLINSSIFLLDTQISKFKIIQSNMAIFRRMYRLISKIPMQFIFLVLS